MLHDLFTRVTHRKCKPSHQLQFLSELHPLDQLTPGLHTRFQLRQNVSETLENALKSIQECIVQPIFLEVHVTPRGIVKCTDMQCMCMHGVMHV